MDENTSADRLHGNSAFAFTTSMVQFLFTSFIRNVKHLTTFCGCIVWFVSDLITDRAVVLMWFFVACFGVRVSVKFHFMFVDYTFSSVWIADWPPFVKKLPPRLAFVFVAFCLFVYFIFISHFRFKSGICLLIAQVSVHCSSITFVVDIKTKTDTKIVPTYSIILPERALDI